jgi:hypothetical protein
LVAGSSTLLIVVDLSKASKVLALKLVDRNTGEDGSAPFSKGAMLLMASSI